MSSNVWLGVSKQAGGKQAYASCEARSNNSIIELLGSLQSCGESGQFNLFGMLSDLRNWYISWNMTS